MVVSAGFAVAGRKGVWGVTVVVKLRITGLDEVVVPDADDDELEAALLELELDDPELLDEPDDPEVLDEPEALPLVPDVLDVDDDPALALDVLLLDVVACAPPPEPPWPPPEPLAPPPCPEAEPLMLLLPAVVP